MPTGNLPSEGKKIWEKVYESAKTSSTCKDAGDRKDECAARVAWTAVKNAGWSKDGDGNWHKKADFQTFSLAITKASYDKANNGEMRWKASASDTEDDLYGDNMTLDLFEDFLERINTSEPAPEEFKSTFWAGGMPYLSVSHYPDLEGKAVPGTVDNVFIDGNFLKSEGTFSDTPLGRACFKAVCSDLYGDNKDREDKVRISIAFIDWKHKHKDTGFIFERKSLEDSCPECFKNMIVGIMEGEAPHPTLQGAKEFLSGQLIHEAMTRVPVNTRTLMEVERAMTTRKEDAESIVGELAEELEEEAKLVGKSQALVIKADEEMDCAENESEEDCRKRHLAGKIADAEPGMELVPAKSEGETPEPEEGEEEKAEEVEDEFVDEEWIDNLDEIELEEKSDIVEKASKKEAGCEHPSSHYLVVEDSTKPTTWHLRFKDCSGKVDRRLLGAAWAALHGGYRGNKYSGPGRGAALAKLKRLRKGQGMEEPKSLVLLEEIKALLTKETPSHPLDGVFAELKSQFDAQIVSGASEDDILRALQEPYAAIGEVIKSTIRPKTTEEKPQVNDTMTTLAQTVQQLAQQVSLISTKLDGMNKPPTEVVVPARRSIDPKLVLQKSQVETVKSATPRLRDIINRTT